MFKNLLSKQKKTLLVVDFNNLLYKAVHVHPDLYHTTKLDKVYTGGLYGFIQQIKFAINRFQANDMVVCTDSPPYLRNFMISSYKKNREKPSDIKKKIEDSRILIEEFLSCLDIRVIALNGFEADDLIYAVCDWYDREYGRIIVLSNDKDLYQIFDISSNIYMLKSLELINIQHFKRTYDIEPWKWSIVNALQGGHNGLPGFRGVGEKTAINMAKKFIYMHPYYLFADKETKKTLKKANINTKKLEKYYRVTRIPLLKEMFYIPSMTNLNFNRPTKASLKEADKFLKHYGFTKGIN